MPGYTNKDKSWSDDLYDKNIGLVLALHNVIALIYGVYSFFTGHDLVQNLNNAATGDADLGGIGAKASRFPRLNAAAVILASLIALPFTLSMSAISVALNVATLSFSAISTIYSGIKWLFHSKAPNDSNSEVPGAENVTSPYNDLEEEEEFTLDDTKSPTMTTAFANVQQQSNGAATNNPIRLERETPASRRNFCY